ncbi:MAG: acid phosphatase [Haliea sp.]|nr:acid phosphatase [Haliea sp.]
MASIKLTTVWKRWLSVLALFVALMVIAEFLELKFLVADGLYQLEGGQWSLRHHFITETILHDGIRKLNLSFVVFVLFLTVTQFLSTKGDSKRRRYVLLLLSVLLSFGLVNYLKAMLGMDCPWDLQLYGGAKPYISLWSFNDTHFGSGRCFPSGHSSIGFAWIALYFFWRKSRPFLARASLTLSLFCGFVLGGVQQLRGAHFFIDDITTAFICWSVSLFIFHIGEQYASTHA